MQEYYFVRLQTLTSMVSALIQYFFDGNTFNIRI